VAIEEGNRGEKDAVASAELAGQDNMPKEATWREEPALGAQEGTGRLNGCLRNVEFRCGKLGSGGYLG